MRRGVDAGGAGAGDAAVYGADQPGGVASGGGVGAVGECGGAREQGLDPSAAGEVSADEGDECGQDDRAGEGEGEGVGWDQEKAGGKARGRVMKKTYCMQSLAFLEYAQAPLSHSPLLAEVRYLHGYEAGNFGTNAYTLP